MISIFVIKYPRGEYGKVGMYCISGEPNKGKTALGKTALSLCSNTAFLFSYKVRFSSRLLGRIAK